MDRTQFRKYLESRRADEATIERSFALAERFEAYARNVHHIPADAASGVVIGRSASTISRAVPLSN